MLIARLVTMILIFQNKLTHRPSDGMVPRAERKDVGGPLAVDGAERYSLLVRAPGQILRSMNTPTENQRLHQIPKLNAEKPKTRTGSSWLWGNPDFWNISFIISFRFDFFRSTTPIDSGE